MGKSKSGRLSPAVFFSLLFLILIPLGSFAIEQVEFKNEIPLASIGTPEDIAADSEGNIYIADSDKAMVHVLDKTGKIKRSWGGSSAKGYRMKEPSGISVYRDMVYVSDKGADAVHIFTKAGSYIDTFGGGGSGPKEFSGPSGICAARGALYVADTGNRRIQVFSLDGVYTGSFGGKETLDGPRDVSVDYRGYVLVADSENIKTFTPSGKLDAAYHTFKKPVAINADGKGFYAADNRSYQVKKFDLRGNPTLSFGAEGKGSAQFRNISGIALGPSGEVLVVDKKKNTLQIFSARTEHVMMEEAPYPSSVRWSKDISSQADRLLYAPPTEGLTSPVSGRLFAADRKTNTITVFEGSSSRTFSPAKKGGWKNPGGMAIDPEGLLWVTDSGNDRVIKLNSEGAVVAAIGSSGSRSGYFSGPSDIDISPSGTIYVADTGNSRVQAFMRDGVFLRALGDQKGDYRLEKPVALSLDRSDNIYVLDANTSRVVIFDAEGRRKGFFGGRGDGNGKLKDPSDIAVTATEVYVLDSGNKRVQVFDLVGRYLREFGAEGKKGKGDFSGPTSIAIADATQIYIADPSQGRVQLLDIILTPKTPTELRAEGGMREVSLSWETAGEDFVQSYRIYRSTDKLDYKEVGTSEDAAFSDKVAPDTTYYYRVSALAKGGNESGLSNMAFVTAIKYIPPAPAWISANPGERLVAITWAPVEESFVTGYAVYKEEAGEFKLVSRTEKTGYVDRSVKPETAYTYRITAVSSDGVESDAVTAKVLALKETKPPVELAVTGVSNVFSNNYKYYEKEPVASARVTNNTGERLSKLKVSFMIKEFMDYPTESEVDNLQPWQSVEVPLRAVFNSKIIEITENTPVQASIKVSYYENDSPRTYSASQTLTIYERHYVTWDVRERIATFVTPKDPVVLEFTREIARQYADLNPDPMIYARAVFDALGAMGFAYVPDPNSPYASAIGSSGRGDYTDYVQYPRETLLRKSGDCDDLANLYASALESIGIETRLLDMPGHIMMMFSTGMDKSLIQSADSLKDMFVLHEGYAWIPVETTLVGSSFVNAWKRGVAKYNEKKDEIEIIDLRKAWESYKPASLPPSNWRPEVVYREEIESRYGDGLEYIKNLRIRYQSAKYLDRLYANPSDREALLQTGIVYGENENPKAAEFFGKILDADPRNAAALNNMGNVHFIQGRHGEAMGYYETAASIEPGDPHIWVNLARCYLKLGEKAKAKDAFERAYTLDPEVSRTYRSIAFQVGDPALMLR